MWSRVTGEPGRTLVPLTEVLGQVAGLTEQLAALAARNEALALEVGQLRERTTRHEALMAAKDHTLAVDTLALAELRRAEAAEAERDALRMAPTPPVVPPGPAVARGGVRHAA